MLDKLVHKTLNVPYRLNVSIDHGPRDPKKVTKTVVMLHGIGAKGEMWRSIIDKVNIKNTRFIALDLLGFGKSPKPDWLDYRLNDNVRAIERTLYYIDADQPDVLVGHSLGSLVAVEYAKNNSPDVSNVILVSPPFYKQSDGSVKTLADKFYDNVYHYAFDKTDRKVVGNVARLHQKMFAKNFDPTSVDTQAFRNTLMAGVLDHDVFDDAKTLKQPTQILFGRYDPVVIKANLSELVKANPNVKMSTVAAGHEIIGVMSKAVVGAIDKALQDRQ